MVIGAEKKLVECKPMSEKILIIDDEIETIRLTGLILEKLGYQILASSSGKMGLELVKREHPDLIVLDISLQGLDGYQIARMLRDDPVTMSIPIVMFTGKSRVNDKVEGLEAGADAYITKPANPAELIAQVQSLLKRHAQVSHAQVLPREQEGRIIAAIAAKGGIGISTLATNLAIELHKQFRDPLILSDFRPGQGTISMDLDLIDTTGMMGLSEMRQEDINPHEVDGRLQVHTSGIKTLLSSSQPHHAKYILKGNRYLAIAKSFRSLALLTVLDLGPALSPVALAVISECDKILVCCEPFPHNIAQTKTLLQELNKVGVGPGRIIPVLIKRQPSSVQLSLLEIEEALERKIEQVFNPVPELAYLCAMRHTPIVLSDPDNIAAKQFQTLAERILQQELY